MKSKILVTTLCLAASVTPANAEEACSPAKDMVRMIKAFYAADPEHIDIIDPSASIKFNTREGQTLPDQVVFRHEDEKIFLKIDKEGQVQDLELLKSAHKSGEICRVVNGEIPEISEDEKISVNVGFSFPYRQKDGVYTISDLREGAKDGSKIMKGVAPGGLGFVVPGLKTISLTPTDKDGDVPDFEFLRDGQIVPIPVSIYDKTHYFRLKDIKSSKVDMLKISGPHQLGATFKINPEELAEAEAKRLQENP